MVDKQADLSADRGRLSRVRKTLIALALALWVISAGAALSATAADAAARTVVGRPSPTPRPSPSPRTAPSPSPTASPIVKSSPSPTPNPSPKASPTPSPNPSPSPSPSAAPPPTASPGASGTAAGSGRPPGQLQPSGQRGGAPPGWPWPDAAVLIVAAMALAAFAVRQAAARGVLALPASVFRRGGAAPALSEMESRAVYRSAVPSPPEGSAESDPNDESPS
jgi:hypothetical protein